MFKKDLFLLHMFFLVMVGFPTLANTHGTHSAEQWLKSQYGNVRFISGVAGSGAETLPIGLEFSLPKGWKIYWKNPGDAGLPPTFDHAQSTNIKKSVWLWPKPVHFAFGGVKTKGYKDHIIFPWDVTVRATGKATALSGTIHFLSCKDICVPVSGNISLTIPPGSATPTKYFTQIEKYRAQVPLDENTIHDTENKSTYTNFLWIVFIALLGGFILNIMPCVLPVLSVKAISVMDSLQKKHDNIRKKMLWTALGIIFSFLCIGSALSILKAIGMGFGWGIQFQQPVFLALMMLIMIICTANIWDIFHISPPSKILRAMPAVKNGYIGSFFNGVLATILATPCLAPFLTTALGFALATSIFNSLVIFLAMGVGMATPYLLLSLFPRFALFFPKSGAWTVIVKKGMGVLMLATAIFFGWILSFSIGAQKTFMVSLAGFVIVVLLSMQKTRKKISFIYKLRGILCITTAFAALVIVATNSVEFTPSHNANWIHFKESKIKYHVAKGDSVLVNVTARWCITCMFNEKFTFDNVNVRKQLKEKKVILMQADWTKPDPVIANFLKKYGRFGIPFTIVYSKSKPQGIILPEVLTPSILLKAVDKANMESKPRVYSSQEKAYF